MAQGNACEGRASWDTTAARYEGRVTEYISCKGGTHQRLEASSLADYLPNKAELTYNWCRYVIR